MNLDDFSESDIRDYAREARIRENLDSFFIRGEDQDLHSVNRMAEGLGDPKRFARSVASSSSDFYQDEGVFVLLGEEEGNLNVVAYDDGDVSLRKDSDHWELYNDILGSQGLEPGVNPGVVPEMPDVFDRPEYSIDLSEISTEYVKTRNGGVIGPGTEQFHDIYSHDEQGQDYWMKI